MRQKRVGEIEGKRKIKAAQKPLTRAPNDITASIDVFNRVRGVVAAGVTTEVAVRDQVVRKDLTKGGDTPVSRESVK
jgi:hypothetical protein